MTSSKCGLSNPNFAYSYCPSYGAAVLFAVLFSLTTAVHVYQAKTYRKPFAVVLIMGGLWEVLGYIIRSISVHHPLEEGLQTAQMLLVLLAPLWINAFIYMLVGRMIHFFLDDDRILGVKARKLTLIFVAFDITAFVVQGTGGSMSSSNVASTALTGLHVYTAGVALQIVFNTIFLAIVGKLHKMVMATSIQESAQTGQPSYGDCMFLLRSVYFVVGLLFLRNFYRLAEFASGLNSTIITHEWYGYVFDAVPMLAAMIILNVLHPGCKLQGQRCDFTEEDRAMKQARRDLRKAKEQSRQEQELTKVAEVSTIEVDRNCV